VRVCRSPWLIAAYRGLPRLRVPRHPPHAFARLTTKSFQTQTPPYRKQSTPTDHSLIIAITIDLGPHAQKSSATLESELDENSYPTIYSSMFTFQIACGDTGPSELPLMGLHAVPLTNRDRREELYESSDNS
jgi:hypothetical protein